MSHATFWIPVSHSGTLSRSVFLEYPGEHLLCKDANYYTGHDTVSVIQTLPFKAVIINPGSLDHPAQPQFFREAGAGAWGGAELELMWGTQEISREKYLP